MATGTGINVSKVNAYAVLWSNPGANVSKVNAYAVLASADVAPPSWPVFSFGSGVVGIAYAQQFTPNGAAPVTVTVSSGSLPAGLSLANVSGSTYKISGTPTVAGVSSFTLRATNAYGSSNFAASITIIAAGAAGGSYAFIG